MLASVIDDLREDFRKIESLVSVEDRRLLDQHVEMVRTVEKELKTELESASKQQDVGHAVPQLLVPLLHIILNKVLILVVVG